MVMKDNNNFKIKSNWSSDCYYDSELSNIWKTYHSSHQEDTETERESPEKK